MMMLSVIAAAFIYLFFAGLAYPHKLAKAVDECPWSKHHPRTGAAKNNKGEYVYISCEKHHARVQAIFSSLPGPIILPFVIGAKISATKVTKENKKAMSDEQKKAQEIKDAKHKLELAKIEAESIKILEDAAGINQ